MQPPSIFMMKHSHASRWNAIPAIDQSTSSPPALRHGNRLDRLGRDGRGVNLKNLAHAPGIGGLQGRDRPVRTGQPPQPDRHRGLQRLGVEGGVGLFGELVIR